MTGFPFGVEITVLTPALAADPYSGESTSEDWTSAASRTVCGVGVGPRVSEEPIEDGRSRVSTGVALYLRGTGEVISARERVVITEPAGYAGTWLVDGDPQVYAHPMSGWQAGTVVPIRRVSG